MYPAIRKCALIFFAVIITGMLYAQDYLTGKLTDTQLVQHGILYDRTQNAMGLSVYQTLYKVMDTNQVALCSISLTHDGLKGVIYIELKQANAPPKAATLVYDKKMSGLVLSEKGTADTVFNMADKYEYLLSFTGVERDYPVLHKITDGKGRQMQLDPLTKLRLKKNAEMIRALAPPVTNKQVERDSLLVRLLQMRDSLYAKSAFYYESIAQTRGKLEADVKHYFGENKVYENESRYGGEMKNGKPEGNGVLIQDGNIYDGLFAKGVLIDGSAALKKDFGEYYGQYNNATMNGTGWLKYKNGNFWLGIFSDGNLSTGIALAKETTGEVFFGTYTDNKRTGYGELRNPQGNCYYGEFQDGRLVKGYAREIDQFGYATYSRIEKGSKRNIEPQEAGEFFDTNLYVKK